MKITKVGSSAQAEVHLFLGELSDEHAEWEQIFHELMQDDDEDSHELMSHLDPWDPVVVSSASSAPGSRL